MRVRSERKGIGDTGGKIAKVRLLYRIGLSSNTATPLALSVRIELLCFCSCIRKETSIATDTATAADIMT